MTDARDERDVHSLVYFDEEVDVLCIRAVAVAVRELGFCTTDDDSDLVGTHGCLVGVVNGVGLVRQRVSPFQASHGSRNPTDVAMLLAQLHSQLVKNVVAISLDNIMYLCYLRGCYL